MIAARLKALLEANNSAFWDELDALTQASTEMEALLELSVWRQRAQKKLPPKTGNKPLRLALLGGCTLQPLQSLLVQLLHANRITPSVFIGEFDNYPAELSTKSGSLSQFRPETIVVIPSVEQCHYRGSVLDDRSVIEAAAVNVAQQLLAWCHKGHELTGAEFIVANYPLPARDDLGAYRVRTPGSEWTFRKLVNLELGFRLPPFARICDVEFLTHRLGAEACSDPRRWLESKQPGSPLLLLALARELAWQIRHLRQAPRKVLVTDLDNTLWGGILADDGLEGIEIGDTSPRAEAFKGFQVFLKSLQQRGVLLAVCSKNEESIAREALERHPEMILRLSDFAKTKINWLPKPDNLRALAAELELGLDSFVFVDDNPAEIEIVRQFVPEVRAILLGPDPADYIAQVQEARCFEPHSITHEDTQRAEQYRAEAARREFQVTCTDMESYWRSLEMTGTFRDFNPVDAARLAQLTQRTNQFNLTTKRRTEAEILDLAARPDVVGFSFRLQDRFGDHGLVALLIGIVRGESLEVDTWLMSCRVLNRQVEETMLNFLAGRALEKRCRCLRGIFRPTAKNMMVRDLYTRLGFTPVKDEPDVREWELPLTNYLTRPSSIHI